MVLLDFLDGPGSCMLVTCDKMVLFWWSHNLTILKNEKAKFKVALRRFWNVHSFSSVDEFFMCKDDHSTVLWNVCGILRWKNSVYFVYLWLVPCPVVSVTLSIHGMYVRMLQCMYICYNICMYVSVCTYVMVYVYMYVAVYVHMLQCMYICCGVCMYVTLYVRMLQCICYSVCTYVTLYVHMLQYMYVC